MKCWSKSLATVTRTLGKLLKVLSLLILFIISPALEYMAHDIWWMNKETTLEFLAKYHTALCSTFNQNKFTLQNPLIYPIIENIPINQNVIFKYHFPLKSIVVYWRNVWFLFESRKYTRWARILFIAVSKVFVRHYKGHIKRTQKPTLKTKKKKTSLAKYGSGTSIRKHNRYMLTISNNWVVITWCRKLIYSLRELSKIRITWKRWFSF